jgi:hypothetical protein
MARRAIVTKVRKPKKTTVRVGKKGVALASSGNTLTKDFRPKDSDVLRYGPEPSFTDSQPIEEQRQSILSDAYNWYSRFCTHKDSKLFLIQYLEDTNMSKDVVKLVRKAPDNRMVTTAGWAARCATRGLVLTEKQKNYIQACVDRLVDFAKAGVKDEPAEGEETVVEKPKRTVNIQEVMREKADEALSDVEALFDEFITAGCPKDFSVDKKIIGFLTSRNVLPQHIANAIKRYTSLLNEYNEAVAGNDDQVKEAYSSYGKMQLRYTVKFIEDIIAELNGYIGLKQATKKVRAKKVVPVEKVVAKVKFQKTNDALGITSVSPVKLHQCAEAFLYDTAKRKIIWLVADEYSKCLIVKGNAVIGFDKKKSMSKTVRKPEEFLKGMMSASRPNTRKMIDDIKAVAAIPNGRFNENIVILKVW